MSKDGQDSGWAEFGTPSKKAQPINIQIAVEPLSACSLDFALGPATREHLFQWVNEIDHECPNVFKFDVKQFNDVVESCLTSAGVDKSPSPQSHRIWIRQQLQKSIGLWNKILRSDLIGVCKIRKGKVKSSEAVFMHTIKQLHRAYTVWCLAFADDEDDGSDAAWRKFESELREQEVPLDCLQLESNGVVLPRYLFQASIDFGPGAGKEEEAFLAGDISAWFSLFAIYDAFKQLGLAACQFFSWRPDDDQSQFTSRIRDIKDQWVESHNIAVQWCNRSWLFDEIIDQVRQNLVLKAELRTAGDFDKEPDEPHQALGRETLFKWFMKSSLNLSEADVWRARHMAQYGKSSESVSLSELKETYERMFNEARKEFQANKATSEQLQTLCREGKKKIKKTRVHEVMAKLIPCAQTYIAGALSGDKEVLKQYRQDVVDYKIKRQFSKFNTFNQEKRKLFDPQ